ncbi:hypothetical protein [Bathymodiolus platifrons methanotrophic gill symbiont]|uniref:hypothetical protein n=1 Tax=Bathymodiolus platifrons methanotrophic gill symbiont TaxID=113268 RepID=UPI00112501A0|nr:hypothetical protein [Bathymodiolus platifrons methanotrophic gill symbiont]
MMILKRFSVVCLFCLFSGGVAAAEKKNHELSIPDSALGIVWDRSGDFPVASTPYIIDKKVRSSAIADMGVLNSDFRGSLIASDAVFEQAKSDHSYMTKVSSFWNRVNIASDRYQQSMFSSSGASSPSGGPYPTALNSDNFSAPDSSNTVPLGAGNKPANGIGSALGSNHVPPGSASDGFDFSPSTVYSLGDVGPAGGLVFIVSSNGTRGMEVQWKDFRGSAAWGCLNVAVPVAFGDRLGSGEVNTYTIQGSSCLKAGDAIKLASPGRFSYSDWHLPSAAEFRVMSEFIVAYKKKSSDTIMMGNMIGDLGDFGGSYWTSTQYIYSLPLRDSSLAVAGVVSRDSSLPLVNSLSYVPRSRVLKLRLIHAF